MIAGIASLVFIPLLAIALAHLMWASGSTWPVRDEQALARTVTGFSGTTRMPARLLSAVIALFILGAGLWALAMSDPGDSLMLTLGGALLALIFLGRGIAGYTAGWRRLTPEEPFATFDRKFYSPLSLGIGAGFLLLVIWRLM